MPACLYCKKSGWFFSVDRNRLCAACAPIIAQAVPPLLNCVHREAAAVSDGNRNAAWRLAAISRLEEALEELKPFRDAGLPFLSQVDIYGMGKTAMVLRVEVVEQFIRETAPEFPGQVSPLK